MMTSLRRAAPALLSGVLLFLAFPAANLHFLAWFALVPLIWRATRLSPGAAGAQFFCAGWVFHTLLLQWLAVNMFWAGGWAVFGQQAMVLALSLFWGLGGSLWRLAHGRSSVMGGAVLLAALFVCVEWIHAHTLTGFGWPALAYSQGPNLPVLQWAALGGTGIVAFFIVACNGWLALAVSDRGNRLLRLVLAACVVVGSHVVGYMLLQPATYAEEPLRAGVFQSNFPNEMKWDREYHLDMVESAVARSRSLKQYEDVDLVVWPEALIMTDYRRPDLLDQLRQLATAESVYIFSGTVRDDPENRAGYNSSVLVGPGGEVVDYYDKVHLAPFGEYDPFEGRIPGLSAVVPGSVSHGSGQKVLPVGSRTLGPLICFETLFAPMARQLREDGADFLVVITNLAWFGSSNAIPQELELARLRAIENRLPLVHAANTGISGAFDPYGRFRPADAYVGPNGRYYKNEAEVINPMSTAHQRLVGAYDLAEPGGIFFSPGQQYFAHVGAALATLLFLLALVFPGRPAPPSVQGQPIDPAAPLAGDPQQGGVPPTQG
jgi:apolipoprotein N-acyltransferase